MTKFRTNKTPQEQRDFLIAELLKESQGSWDIEADGRFADFLGHPSADIIGRSWEIGLTHFVFQSWSRAGGCQVKRLRLKRLNELINQGLVVAEWRGTGTGGKTEWNVGRVRAYFLKAELDAARQQ